MVLRTPSLITERDYLLSLRRQGLLSSTEYKTQVAKLEKKQKTNDKKAQKAFEKREALRIQKEKEAEKKAEEERKKKEAIAKEKAKLRSKKYRLKKKNLVLKNAFTSNLITNLNKPYPNITLNFGNDFISDIDLMNLVLANTDPTKQWQFKLGALHYTLSDKTRLRLIDIINNGLVVNEASTESDGMVVQWITEIKHFDIFVKPPTNQYAFVDVAFFPYINLTKFNLYKYGVFSLIDKDNYEDTCLIYALRMAGMDDERLELIKTKVKNRIIPKSSFNEICDLLQIKIILKTLKKSKEVFGKDYEETYHIGAIENHCFIIDRTNITRYSIENYDDVKDKSQFNLIYKKQDGYYKRDASKCLDSFDVIKILLENKQLLKQISNNDRDIASTQFYDKISKEIENLNYNEKECIVPITIKESQSKEDEFKNVFFDFETYVKDGVHIPYLVRTDDGFIKNEFIGENCPLLMLGSLKGPTRLIAHNANYDYRFIIKHLTGIKEISRGNRLIACSAKFISKYNNVDIQIKDSLHLISMALSKFPKTFQIEGIEKEVMPYSLYNEETVKERFINIDYALTFVAESDKEHFLANIKKWKLEKDGKYDIIRYSSIYCGIDCDILRNGYNTFKTWILDLLKIDIDNVLTVASLAHKYFINQGCYNGVNELGGIPQMFIQGCVVGGRTMTAENKKISIEEKVNDFDAVSLYPSAMSRMDGFLMGSPKIIENLSYDWLSNQDGYFVDIIVNEVGIHRKFPLMSAKNENGVRVFTNDVVGKTIRLDKYSLEDLIKFHQIKFTIVRGYYFNEGFNSKIKEVIDYIFTERLRMKKEGNPAQEVYKLVMNSGYGKTIMKPIETESRFFDNEEKADVFISRHYNHITEYIKFGDKTKINTVKTLIDHFNIAQVGVCILSMSKRIMNEVMCLAEDNGLDLYYQDTDSIHIKDKDIVLLAKKYGDIYNKELIGKNMGQFHSDFDLDGCKNVYASRSIFLGKKCYIDELKGIDKNGNEQTGFHIRMKGIPNKVILHTTDKLGYENPFQLYQDLYKGKEIEFDLTNDGTKANFKFDKMYGVRTLDFFIRKIKF
jgi:hypothetical protein